MFSSFTLTVIGCKEGLPGVLGLGFWGVVQALFFVVGVFQVIRFRHPMVEVEFMRDDAGICVWCDPNATDDYQRFVAEVKRIVHGASPSAEADAPARG